MTTDNEQIKALTLAGVKFSTFFAGEKGIMITLSPSEMQTVLDRIKELEIALIGTDDALFWLLNLLHGNSKGGPDFSPPNNAEWTGAIGQGKEAHEVAEKALGGDA